MTLLRIYCSLRAGPLHCHWLLSETGRTPIQGEGTLADAPFKAARVQLIVSADEVLLTRANLPQGAKRRASPVLAFAVEDDTLGEPEANYASWLGSAGDADVLAVMDKQALKRWLEALNAAGIHRYEVHCETLLLPRVAGEWSLAWDGGEGFVRTGEFEGAATDSGTRQSPPLSLRLLLEAAATRAASPAALALYLTMPDAGPDLEAWQSELGVPVRLAGAWNWREAANDDGINLVLTRRHWRLPDDLAARLKPAAWIAGAALALHSLAVVADWSLLRSEQRALNQRMEARFRAAVPDAVAVVDPALQMRRMLAGARHIAGVKDDGDFLPMVEKAAAAFKELPAGTLRVASFEQGRLSLELAGIDVMAARRFVARLLQGSTNIDASVAPVRSGGGVFVVTVRAL
jgi:general secretion pathway protein L